MCGIVGVLGFSGGSFRITEEYLRRMRDVMVHRGPDGSGMWISTDGLVGLGHRRLSIIDLSQQASQPMCNEDRSLWVSFNGEIYNHAEIRAELQKAGGHRWKTDHSDTEVILHAFEQWGIDCISRFRGMFAIALWDAAKRELWLIRDRMGIKPLYYSVHHGRITFASEIKALLQDLAQDRAVDEQSFYHYLSFLTTPAPKTLFAGIRKLRPGTWLRVGADGQTFEHTYWDVLDHTTPLVNSTDEEIAERLLEKLRSAVRLRKVSDVPVGIFLSGGIDSSTNAKLFSEGENQAVRTFSIGYDQNYSSYKSELPFARMMAKQVGAHHHERIVTQQDLLAFLPKMIHLQDEPIADPVCVPVYFVAEMARQNGVIVCQVGEGADELFWGYPTWKIKWQLQRLNQLPFPGAGKRMALAGMRLAGHANGFAFEFLRRGTEKLPIFWGGAEAFTELEKTSILSPRLRQQLAGLSSWSVLEPIRKRFEEKCWQRSPLQWMSYLDLNCRLPELLLMRIDKMTMGTSLEGRVPFLDHELVEFAMSIPEFVKTRHGDLKFILKKAVRGLIPDEIINRKKQGFGVPVYEWFFDKLGAYARSELDRFMAQTDFFDPSGVRGLFDSRQSAKIWYLLNFALWWKHYIAADQPGCFEENALTSAAD
jgi:asparagine synthase (glutamine-hydrolysing)